MGTLRWQTISRLWMFCVCTLLLLTACPNTGQEKSLTQIRSQLSVLSTEVRESFEKSEEDRISLYKKLNNDIRLLQKNQADTSAVNDELRASLTAIDAKLDEYNERMKKLSERLNVVETAVTERITFLSEQVDQIGSESTISPEPTPFRQQTPIPMLSTPTPSSEIGLDPEVVEYYRTAYTAYINGDFDTAIAGFERYLELYPETELADLAQYWIAESFFSLGEFETALEEYDKFITKYPDSDKIPAAYFSKADVFLKLDRQLEARSHLQYIVNQFPNSAAAQRAEERLRTLDQ